MEINFISRQEIVDNCLDRMLKGETLPQEILELLVDLTANKD